MGSSENIQIKDIPFGTFTADGVPGKVENGTTDSVNIRYDLFGGIQSVLGNTAYNIHPVGGSYNLGGDIFQYTRNDGTFDVVLSRQKAEGKLYRVTGAQQTQYNVISTTADWNNGMPPNGDNLFSTSGDKLTLISNSVISNTAVLNPSFETGTFANWTNLGGTWVVSTTTPYSGTYCAKFDNAGLPFGVAILDTSNNVLVSYTPALAAGWTKYVIPASALTAYVGQNIKIKFTVSTFNDLRSDVFTYVGDNISFYYKRAESGGSSHISVDLIQTYYPLQTELPAVNYGVTPLTFGNFTTSVDTAGASSVIFEGTSSANGVTYGSWVTITVAAGTFTVNSQSIPTSITLNPFFKARFSPILDGDTIPKVSNYVIDGEWTSAVQNLGGIPTSWGDPLVASVTVGGTSTIKIATSSDGTNFSPYIPLVSGVIPTVTLTQYISYKTNLSVTDTIQAPEMDSISLAYNLTTAGGSAPTTLVGWAGSGFDTYFGILNNKLIISDGTTTPVYWTGGTQVTVTVISNSITVSAAPSGMYPEVHYGRYFLAYNANYPSRIWWSNNYDPLTWDTANQFIDVNPDDGDFITGIKSYGGVLYVFKHEHPYLIQGNDFDPTTGNYTVQSLQQLPGCESHNSIKVASDSNMYWYSHSGIIQFSGSTLPTYIGRGIVDQTIKNAGFKQNLDSYNVINTIDFIGYNEIWFAFGHTIYSYNYGQGKWSRIYFDNNPTGNNVYSLTQYFDPFSNNILSFTGNNVIEQWQDSSTFYIQSLTPSVTVSIQSYYTTDFLDSNWYISKNNFKALLSVRQLTSPIITLTNFMDFNPVPIATVTITTPTTLLPDQYRRIDLAALNGRRAQLRLSSLSGQFGISSMAIQTEPADGGRI